MPEKTFRKGKQDIELKTTDLKVFLRFTKPMPMTFIRDLVNLLRKPAKVVLIPNNIDVIVVEKDGSIRKY